MRPWRQGGAVAAGFALIALSLIASPAAATTAAPGTTGGTSPAADGATVAINPAIKDLLASRSGPVDTGECETLFSVACYEPAQIQTAYDEGPLFQRGVTGRGQTIAVIDPFGSPTIAADLATFDSSFGLPPPPSLRIIQPAGPIPPFDSSPTRIDWASETTLDVEWAHVMAPGANILLVETPVAETEGTTGFRQIVQAENYVIDHHLAGIISQSFSATEQTLPHGIRSLIPLRTSFINAFYRGVTVLASSGDSGSTEPLNSAGTELSTTPVTTWPASDPLVTGVGGTQLHLSATGARTGPDSVWNDGYNTKLDQEFLNNNGPDALASGGGLSVDFSRPGYQSSVAGVVGRARGVPDVSMSAACNGAVDVYESFPGIGTGWYLSCGTSESTPLFAGIVALADQMAHRPLGLINPAMYKLSAERAPGISDVTTGNNTVAFYDGKTLVTVPGHAAGPGYDLATGVGTIDAARFVPELVEAVTGRHHPYPVHHHLPCPGDGHGGYPGGPGGRSGPPGWKPAVTSGAPVAAGPAASTPATSTPAVPAATAAAPGPVQTTLTGTTGSTGPAAHRPGPAPGPTGTPSPAQPSTSTSTSGSPSGGPAATGAPPAAGTMSGYVSVVVPSGVLLGPPALVGAQLRPSPAPSTNHPGVALPVGSP